MLPFHLPLWETDATLRAAIAESVQASVTSLGSFAVLSGGELACDARAAGPRSLYTVEARARYARAFDLAVGGGAGPPEDDLDADAAAGATWTASERSSVTLDTEGSLATSLPGGTRADSLLIEPDPFSAGQRLEYAVGADLGWSFTPGPRGELTVGAGYAEAGALWADAFTASLPGAVGADSREGHTTVAYSFEVGPRVSLTPEVGYTFTHYAHTIYDVGAVGAVGPGAPALYGIRRGPADVHEVSATLGASCKLSPDLVVTANGGFTVGSPMPVLRARAPVASPEAGAGLRWTGRRARLTARYSYAYTSLGPRLGYGQRHTGTLRLTAWPFPGASGRDTVLTGVLRASYGAAPLGTDPEPPAPGMPPLRPDATLTAAILAGHTALEIPVARRLAFTPGVDLTFVRGVIDAAQPGTATGPRVELTAMLTLGLAVTFSTDPRRPAPRSPGADQDEAARRFAAPAGEGERTEDATPSPEGPVLEDEERDEEP